ncbi:dipeptide ABC transporter ATP-binding protein [Microvirga tunisiensis]|uniref:Dipeptide ABC transporter ATP-binding protein n=2 Tax=Pannonibacter tanglangensis TaxID=2750084 RepID=A0ABW9ZF15_9HYPH|nr:MULTISPECIES: ABC transporter ATP-binding protein [unclassified Pannonibacter]NBN63039.1 dipeptide ABC transporter ATP-binding protein [Pannonibacter sp. XCT-34]NBN78611.1 dipeptide ABC transporter ATP-binding protein [Pannonibacter sp. XCT-53]
MTTTRETVLKIEDLKVDFTTNSGAVNAVRGVNIHVARGETVAIVGESGSGKSQTMMAAMGLLASNGRTAGRVLYNGQNILGLPIRKLNDIRGKKITMIFQEPMTSLDPLYTIGRQLAEPMVEHGGLSWSAARERALELLKLVNIPEPERKLKSYPYELSGGQRQRVMIAMSLANNPDVLIADEPTTALDVTTQAQILELLADLQKRLGMAVVFITHDLGIVRRIADRVYVMRQGEVVEEGETAKIFATPAHPYTRMLLDAEPEGRKAAVADSRPAVIEGQKVRVEFSLGGGLLTKPFILTAVNDVSLVLREGQTLGIVGESGSGKSTLGRALLGLLPAEGRVLFKGQQISGKGRAELRGLRKHMQLVFQDPFGSLSPRMTVGQIITEGLLVHEPSLSSAERDRRACVALEEVSLDPAMRNRYPHEFSGGQRQRIAIARAMVLKPELMVLDEPTSALDRTIQKQIVTLLRDLQAAHGLTYLFISHDLAVVRAMADTVMVMQHGKVVEAGPTEAIFDQPREDYTRKLISAAMLEHLAA